MPSSTAATAHPLRLFPLSTTTTVSGIWAAARDEEDDTGWLAGGASYWGAVGLGKATTSLARDFRRFQAGGVVAEAGGERLAAARALRSFDARGRRRTDDRRDFVLVPAVAFHELSALERQLRAERRGFDGECTRLAVATCSMASPTVATTAAMVSATRAEMGRCERAMRRLEEARFAEEEKELARRPWRRSCSGGGHRSSAASSRRHAVEKARALELEIARQAVATGSWSAFRERQEWHRLTAEREAMAWEDAAGRCEHRYVAAFELCADYEKYCGLVAQYGVPFKTDAEYEAHAPRAGAFFETRLHLGASKFQKMYRLYSPDFRARRRAASTAIERVARGWNARRKVRPVLRLRRRAGAGRPRRMVMLRWKLAVANTKKVHAFVRHIKYGRVHLMIRAWRAICGDQFRSDVVAGIQRNVQDALLADAVQLIADDLVADRLKLIDQAALTAADACAARLGDEVFGQGIDAAAASPWPDWMDNDEFFVAQFPYEALLDLVNAGVVDPDLMEVERNKRRTYNHARRIQAFARARAGRDAARARIARVFRKKADAKTNAPFYLNVATNRRLDRRPKFFRRLFPGSRF